MHPHCLKAPEVQGDGKTTEQHISVKKEQPPVGFRDTPSSSCLSCVNQRHRGGDQTFHYTNCPIRKQRGFSECTSLSLN